MVPPRTAGGGSDGMVLVVGEGVDSFKDTDVFRLLNDGSGKESGWEKV